LRCTCATGTGRSKTAHRPVNDKQSGAPNVHCCNGEEDATAEQMWKEYRAGEVEEAGVDGGRKCSKAMMTVLIDRIGSAWHILFQSTGSGVGGPSIRMDAAYAGWAGTKS
jgi:hypothetical protein